MIRKFIIYFGILFLFSQKTEAQERYFTQFYGTPLNINPALTGNFTGNYRVNLAYRSQWNKNLEHPFSVFTGSIDLNFELGLKNNQIKDAASVGMYFATDKAGILEYGNTEMGFSGAFHKNLGNSQMLSGGLYVSFIQRNINYSNITLEDMFDGDIGYTANSTDLLPANNFSFIDNGIGISYSNYLNGYNGFDFGVAFSHLTTPEISYYKKDQNATPDVGSIELPQKINFHAGGLIQTYRNFELMPRFLYIRQKKQDMATLGMNVRFDLPGIYYVTFGAFGRMAGSDAAYNFDSAGIILGLEIDNWKFGVSYDAAIPNIITYQRNQGTIEFTISYFGKYQNDDLKCPTF